MNHKSQVPVFASQNAWINSACILLLILVPAALSFNILGISGKDISIPFVYAGSDDVWQLVLTKVLKDTGWVLYNPFLGAPDIASWHHNAAAQTSALHSVLMYLLSYLIDDAVRIQQIYYLLNFPLIALTSYWACRLVGVSQVPAVCVGLVFAFTDFRIEEMRYAFLANYFMVPLALVPVYWIISGKYAQICGNSAHGAKELNRLLLSKEFLYGIVFISFLAFSDGYYAFFELLLIGFAFVVRLLSGAATKPAELFAPVAFAGAIVAVAMLLSMPLKAYQEANSGEFFPNGIQDPALVKQPFEAEVYSSSLKMLISPQAHHRLPFMAELGRFIIQTNDDARRFKSGKAIVPLSLVGTLLFTIALLMLAVPSMHDRWVRKLSPADGDRSLAIFNSFLSVSLFVFLCSIFGGIGTLVALVFPTIRAYERFPLFLIFTLFVGGAYIATLLLSRASGGRRVTILVLLALTTAVTLFDQIPGNADRTSNASTRTFLAERRFVHRVEESVSPNSMIYQYPHSQYLENSTYYGWGSFAHVRLYLHSKALRWSNGAAKNSYVENWHLRIAKLPMDQMIDELAAVGFVGMVIDRTVVSDGEYNEIAQTLSLRGSTIENDGESSLAFARFRDSGFRLEYESNYINAARLIVKNADYIDYTRLPSLIDGDTLKQVLAGLKADKQPILLEKLTYPGVFRNGDIQSKGAGMSAISPDDMKGTLTCNLSGKSTVFETGSVTLTLANLGDFDWVMRSGNKPLGIGFHINDAHGIPIRFDNGTRLSLQTRISARETAVVIKQGQTAQFSFSTSDLDLEAFRQNGKAKKLEFGVVQDGNTWFANLRCQVPLVK